MNQVGLKHLIRVIGLCQTPRDLWSEEDNRALKEAREYVQQQRSDSSESKRAQAGPGAVGNPAEDEGTDEVERGVQQKGVPLEEGTSATPSTAKQ